MDENGNKCQAVEILGDQKAGRGHPKISDYDAILLMVRYDNGEEAVKLAEEAGVTPSALSQRFQALRKKLRNKDIKLFDRLDNIENILDKIRNDITKIHDLLMEREE